MLNRYMFLILCMFFVIFHIDTSAFAAANDSFNTLKEKVIPINEVFLDFEGETITILGSGFNKGIVDSVKLGNFGNLQVVSVSPTQIIVNFPNSGLPDGDYTLILKIVKKDNKGKITEQYLE